MKCSFPAFFASSIAVSALALLLHFLLQKNKAVSRFGISCFYFCVVLALLRGYLPLDFCGTLSEGENGLSLLESNLHLTKTYYLTQTAPVLTAFFRRTLFLVGEVPVNLNKILLAVWAAGTIILLWRQASGNFSCKKELTKMPRVEDMETMAVFHKIFQEIFPRKENQCVVVRSDLIGSAAVFGMRKPMIILPNAEYSNRELELVFRHELFHVKHKDYVCKNLCGLLAAVHWWNPIISYLFPKVMVQAQELLVDYCVIKGLKPEEKLCYLECIQKTVKHASANRTRKISIAALGSGGRKRDVLQRFQFIIAQNVTGFTWKSILIGCLFFVLSFTFVFEEVIYPEYDTYGNEIFYFVEGKSYYIKNGKGFDLYLDGRYVYTTNEIIDDFKNLPIYEEEKK